MNKSITIKEEDSILLYTSVFLHLKQEFSRNNANKNVLELLTAFHSTALSESDVAF